MSRPITKLSDNFADYTLRIVCKKCEHVRVAEPHALAKIVGWETPLATVALKMRCSRCHSRGNCALTAVKPMKPRKWKMEG